jgi:hypothetical protein
MVHSWRVQAPLAQWADARSEIGNRRPEIGNRQSALPIVNLQSAIVNGGRVKLKTFLIVVIVAVAIATAAIAMRSEGGLLAGLAPVIHGH